MSEIINSTSSKMVSTPRKRRKQQSPVRNTQFERMLSASHSPEYSMDETSGIYPEESSGGFGGEVNGYGPRNVNMVHDSTVATLIGGRNIAEIDLENGDLENTSLQVVETNEGHTNGSYIEIVPIPCDMQLDHSSAADNLDKDNTFATQTLKDDDPGYGALLGQVAKKKKTITALRCRICGTLLKRSVWQRERNFFSVKCQDILASLEKAVGEEVKKKEGAAYGCKPCFDKLMRLRSVEMQISKLGYERETIVKGIEKSFLAGQRLLSQHNWNGKISTDYFLDEVCKEEDKNGSGFPKHQKQKAKTAIKEVPKCNGEIGSCVKSEISKDPKLQQVPEHSPSDEKIPCEVKNLVNKSASKLIQMLVEKHNMDKKALSLKEGEDHMSAKSKDQEERTNTDAPQEELGLYGSETEEESQSESLDGQLDVQNNWWGQASLLTENCNNSARNSPSKTHQKIARKGMKLRGCFMDGSGHKLEAADALKGLKASQTDMEERHPKDAAAGKTRANDLTHELTSSPTVTEYKIAKINVIGEVFEQDSSEENQSVTIKQEPRESENQDIPQDDTAVHQDTGCSWATETIKWNGREDTSPPPPDIKPRVPVIKIPKVNMSRLGDLSKNYVKDLGVYICEICGKKYPSKSGYRYHVKIHSGDRPFTCKYCQKTFVEAHILRQHERIHTGVKPYKCRWCDASFAQHSQIRVHERRHTKERPYKCDQCDKSFACNASLKAHINSHQNKRPYSCPICGKSYLWPNHLRSHMKYHQEPSYSCSYCEKKFISPSELKNHERSHTGERPYICDLCGKGFTQSCHLGAHKKYTHANQQQKQSLQCGYCDRKFRNYQGTKNHERSCKERQHMQEDSSPCSLETDELTEMDFYVNRLQVKEEPRVEDETPE